MDLPSRYTSDHTVMVADGCSNSTAVRKGTLCSCSREDTQKIFTSTVGLLAQKWQRIHSMQKTLQGEKKTLVFSTFNGTFSQLCFE